MPRTYRDAMRFMLVGHDLGKEERERIVRRIKCTVAELLLDALR
jgi:hypothetical protein